MRQPLIALLLGMACVLADLPARAHATATVTVNGVSRTLSQTGFVFDAVSSVDVVLGPGQSADFTFDYGISVHDDGLPAAPDRLATGCVPLHVPFCNPPYSGFEVVKVDLIAFYVDPRTIPPYIQQTGDSTVVELQTQGDSFADSLTRAGTIHVHITNTDPFSTYSHLYATYAAMWVLASPIPEPAVIAQLLGGLGLLGAALCRRRAVTRSA
jgi:hypothetical protein